MAEPIVPVIQIRTACPCGKEYWSKPMTEDQWTLEKQDHELNKVSQHGYGFYLTTG